VGIQVSQKGHFDAAKEPCTSTKEPYDSAKEPYDSAKEPDQSTKEPCDSTREPCDTPCEFKFLKKEYFDTYSALWFSLHTLALIIM